MTFTSILIANRGEVAVRITRALADLGMRSVAVFAEDDAGSLHVHLADEACPLSGTGAKAYLDADALIAAASAAGCEAIHPGYGFLAERADFAQRCADAGITFIGPQLRHLALFGDKARAREAAIEAGVPVLAGLDHAVSLQEARDFLASLGPGAAIVIKAVSGGGGRGTRVVTSEQEVEAEYERCRSEAKLAFGVADVYVESFLPRARHVEVQILGDTEGSVTHLGERECSLQRRNQKLIEIAPAPGLAEDLRQHIIDAALRLARQQRYSNLGTFEFLVDPSPGEHTDRYFFIEANARLQVEHTVTEAVTGVDLVQAQIRLSAGETLTSLGLDDPDELKPRGYAIQTRVNMETITPEGSVRPSGGTIEVYDPPGGPGVRVDGFGYTGYQTSSSYDSLLAKVVTHTHSPDFRQAAARARRALAEFRLEGIDSNIEFLQRVLAHEDFVAARVHTRWVDEHIRELAAQASSTQRRHPGPSATGTSGHAGAQVDRQDPLALFAHGSQVRATASPVAAAPSGSERDLAGMAAQRSPIQGTIVSIQVEVGDTVTRGQQLAVIEAMKMEHVIVADCSGVVRKITMATGDVVRQDYPVVLLEESEVAGELAAAAREADLDHIRPDLQEVLDRHAMVTDEGRPEAAAKRHGRGYRMPRENIAQLVDPGSFKEYWPLVVARRHQRHDMATLRRDTPCDGVIAGTATVNRELFGEERSRALVVHYDYTVLAGTQGGRGHYKQDRMFELAERFRLPVVLFGEGGGGRPGDDRAGPGVSFDTPTFAQFSKLSGLVPLVGVVNGRTFAGNTALVAACDVIIATRSSTLAMGGPAMIEGGGLGVYTPEEVGPMSFQVPNGVVDILVEDEAEAVSAAKTYLGYFQGNLENWEAQDQRHLRHIVPENRLRLYDMREVIDCLADVGSVLEIRPAFGVGIITAFIRIEGRPVGVIANSPHHLAGAIDSDGADKGARFLQLCDAFDIPVLSLMDCPGIMVGPDAERAALVRHSVRMFNVGANLSTPLFGVVVRKAYGLGVLAMCGASSLTGFFTVAWPTAEFAGMNLEGSVKLGYRKELAAIEDPEERRREFDQRVQRAYEGAKAVNAAVGGGLDDVIDPADTREWIAHALRRLPPQPLRTGKKYPYIDTW